MCAAHFYQQVHFPLMLRFVMQPMDNAACERVALMIDNLCQSLIVNNGAYDKDSI
jgi:hypothetical protein